MLAVVKTLRTKQIIFEVSGAIPAELVKFLERKYKERLSLIGDEEEIDITRTNWYRKARARRTPGRAIKVYRQRDHLTQAELGEKLGGLTIQKISDLEHDRRGISKDLAKKLAILFGTSAEKFL